MADHFRQHERAAGRLAPTPFQERFDMFQIRNFVVVGISRTRHGVSLARAVLGAGIKPLFALISAETDEQLARCREFWSQRDWWRTMPSPCPGSPLGKDEDTQVELVYRLFQVPYLFVPGLNGPIACEILQRAEVDAILLAETPILKGSILQCAARGIVNLHPAPLPEYRGNYATYWALYHDEPLFVTAHLVDRGVDTGPILARQRLPVRRGDSLTDIDRRSFEVCGELAANVLAEALGPGIAARDQAPWEGRTFRGRMPPEIVAECERRLAAGEYSHYE